MVTYRRPTSWTKATSTLFNQEEKANGKCVKALQALCTLWLPWETKVQQIYGPMCFTNIEKNKYFPLNQNLTRANYGICCM